MSRYRRHPSARRASNTLRVLPLSAAAQVTAVNVTDPGTEDAVTTVTLLILSSAARVQTTADSAALAGIYFACYSEGAATAAPCIGLTDVGATPEGRVCELMFDCDADTTREWALQWPGNSQLIKTQQGGCLGGVIGPDQDITTLPFGSLFFGPNDGGLLAVPDIAAVGPNSIYAPGIWQFAVTINGAPADLALAGPDLAVTIAGTAYTVPVSSSGSGSIQLDLSGTPAISGDSLRWNAYSPILRLTDGGYIAPADCVLA